MASPNPIRSAVRLHVEGLEEIVAPAGLLGGVVSAVESLLGSVDNLLGNALAPDSAALPSASGRPSAAGSIVAEVAQHLGDVIDVDKSEAGSGVQLGLNVALLGVAVKADVNVGGNELTGVGLHLGGGANDPANAAPVALGVAFKVASPAAPDDSGSQGPALGLDTGGSASAAVGTGSAASNAGFADGIRVPSAPGAGNTVASGSGLPAAPGTGVNTATITGSIPTPVGLATGGALAGRLPATTSLPFGLLRPSGNSANAELAPTGPLPAEHPVTATAEGNPVDNGLSPYRPAGAYDPLVLLGPRLESTRSAEQGLPETAVPAEGEPAVVAGQPTEEPAVLSDAQGEIVVPAVEESGLSTDVIGLLERGGTLLSDLTDQVQDVPSWVWPLGMFAGYQFYRWRRARRTGRLEDGVRPYYALPLQNAPV